MSNTTTISKPDTIAKAERDVRKAEVSVSEARSELVSATTAHAGAAAADAAAFEQATEPKTLPSAALKTRLDVATARLTARQSKVTEAKASLDDAYRAADEWRTAELAVADQDEADFLALLDDAAAALDRAKASRALAGWVATTSAGTPAPFAGVGGSAGSSGDKLLAELAGRQDAALRSSISAGVRAATQAAAASYAAADAAAAAAAERRQARRDEQQASETRSRQRHVDSINALAARVAGKVG
ncbi:hypothetical protein [Microlunatus antarcticus]|uniref:Uncharacterized protein n=1 Tax=Microlunatus antarcticus TaxID=53388 RepID=A0A7W5P814_9ACTN|nr:hypothetical protein [Microlunatus antarcticus]MBB3327471.1 hypothetical protein [Microlunatus antarcticus]